jgi:hypothetical protein
MISLCFYVSRLWREVWRVGERRSVGRARRGEERRGESSSSGRISHASNDVVYDERARWMDRPLHVGPRARKGGLLCLAGVSSLTVEITLLMTLIRYT